jgi:hypothetical protein
MGTFWFYPRLSLPHAATTNTVLFDREIVRILDEHCVMCHAPNGLSFSLSTYEETWLRRAAIHDQILARHMPPWAAVPGYGKFANANELSLREKRFIVSWVEGLGPRNTGTVFLNVLNTDAAAREEIRAGMDFSAWKLGQPELQISLPATATATATATAIVRATTQRAVIDPGLTNDRWLNGLEFKPNKPGDIRAAVFTLEDTGQWLATWTPWHGFRRLPDGTALPMAAGARIIADIHATDGAGQLVNPGELGLHFAQIDAAPAPLSDIMLVAADEIPADAQMYRLQAETRLTTDASVLALWPEIPSGVHSIEVSATLPDGSVTMLLLALDIPAEWPTPYVYESPMKLPRGSLLSLTAHASNSGPAALRREVLLTLSTVATGAQ